MTMVYHVFTSVMIVKPFLNCVTTRVRVGVYHNACFDDRGPCCTILHERYDRKDLMKCLSTTVCVVNEVTSVHVVMDALYTVHYRSVCRPECVRKNILTSALVLE